MIIIAAIKPETAQLKEQSRHQYVGAGRHFGMSHEWDNPNYSSKSTSREVVQTSAFFF